MFCRLKIVVVLLVFAAPSFVFGDGPSSSSSSRSASLQGPWPQWRGPNRDDLSTESGLLQSWSTNEPQQVWMVRHCGLGYGGPAIVGDRIFLLGTRDEKEQLFCLDASDGEIVWSRELGPIFENNWGNGPRSTPTVDGKHVYAQAADGNLVCAKTSDGSLVWEKSMQSLGGEVPTWGYAESPLVIDDKVLCTPGGEQGTIAALDKKTGKILWQCDKLTDGAHYSSIVTMKHADKIVAVQLLEKQLVGVDTKDGKLLWSESWPGRVAVCPTPIVNGNEVYVSAGYGAGCMLVRIGDDHSVEKIYDNKVMTNHHGGVILVDRHLYGYSERKGWTCQKLDTGEQVWREREALGKGAIAYADGRFYCLSEDEGEVVLIGTTTDGWEEHGRFKLEPQTELRKPRGKIWVHPVIADGRLYLRDQELFFCFDVRASLLSKSTRNGR